MCGRFTLRTPTKAIFDAFGLTEAPDLKARYKIDRLSLRALPIVANR